MASSAKYLIERSTIFVLTILVSITVIFLVPRLTPGDPLSVVVQRLSEMGGLRGAEALVEQYKQLFGLNENLLTQYVSYMREVMHGNLGYSIVHFPTTVSDLILQCLPWTIGLLGTTTILSWIVGTLLGALAGWAGESKTQSILASAALFLYIVPYYIFAVMLVFLFAFTFRLLPASGGYTAGLVPTFTLDFAIDIVQHSILPASTIILSSLGWWFLSMRSMITTVKGEDFLLMAEAKGLPKGQILWRYAFRNAILPQVTGLAVSLGRIVSGALITEVIFAYPGIGSLTTEAITTLDYPLIQGTVLLIVVAVATANFAIEMIYPLIDPRIRHGGE
jgi:peptide/nickel transport system permease protein